MNINPFINLIATVIDIYIFILVIWIILSWLIHFNIVNRHQLLISKLNEIMLKITNPVLKPIREFTYRTFGSLGGIDLSPILLFLLLYFLKDVLYTYFYTYNIQ